MRWFSAKGPKPPQVQVAHILEEGMAVDGTFRFDHGLLLNAPLTGSLIGSPNSSVLVGPKGRLTGPVRTKILVVAGRIDGPIMAEQVWIRNTGVVHGPIDAQAMHVEAGAVVGGGLRMGPHRKGSATGTGTPIAECSTAAAGSESNKLALTPALGEAAPTA